MKKNKNKNETGAQPPPSAPLPHGLARAPDFINRSAAREARMVMRLELIRTYGVFSPLAPVPGFGGGALGVAEAGCRYPREGA